MAYIDVNVDDYPTIKEMMLDNSYIQVVIGPAGSAKTSGCIKNLMMRSMLQKPNAEGIRYTKWLVVRNTYTLMIKNTIPSMENFLQDAIKFRKSSPPYGHGRLPLPDGTTMDIMFEFLSLDTEDAIAKLLGAEPTGVFVDEISEISEGIIDALVSRIGRYPSLSRGSPSWIALIAATNGPNAGHWLYDYAQAQEARQNGEHHDLLPVWSQIEEAIGRPYFRLFQQPPALLRPEKPGDPWLPNPAAENVQHLAEGYGYYYKMLAQSDERIKAYVEGRFSELKTGQVVFPEFTTRLHKFPRTTVADVPVMPIMLSFDFGRTPVCVVAVADKFGALSVIEETVGVDMGIATLWDTVTKPHLRKKFKQYSTVAAYGDPTGKDKRDTLDVSPFNVLEERGIEVTTPWGLSNTLDGRHEAVRRRLTTLTPEGYPMLRVADNCVLTLAAFNTGYIWHTTNPDDPEATTSEPTKSHKNHVSDLMDAVQYLCMGYDAEFIHGKQQDDRIKPKRGSTLRKRR